MEKNLKEQIKYLEGKLDKNENSTLFARLADAYLQMDRVDDAIQLCEKGIKKHPYYVTGHYVLGKCYLKKKLFDQAEKELKRVLLFDSRYIAAHRDYGELMAQIGWKNTCEMSYEEIIRIDPLNEKAKQRLQELKDQLALTREEKFEQVPERELTEVEQNILTEVSPPVEGTIAVEEPVSEELPKGELESEPGAPTITRELFKEVDTVLEDDKTNLDLLEDIFRDDMPLDFSLEEESEANMEGESPISKEEKFDIAEPGYFLDREFQTEPEPETNEFEGLDEDDLFTLMRDDTQPIKSEFKNRIDTSQPETRKEERSKFQSPVDRTLTELPKKDEPKLEPSMHVTPPEVKKEKELIQTLEQETSKTADLMKKKEKIVTPTLGEIYAAQHQYSKAIGVYEILRKKEPDNELYKQKIEYLQKKLEESQSER